MSPAWASRAVLVLGTLALAAAFAMTSGAPPLILLWAVLAAVAVGLWRFLAWRTRPGEASRAAKAGGCLGCVSMFLGGAVLLSLPALLAARASQNMSWTRQSLRRVVEAEVQQAEPNGGLWLPLERLSLPETTRTERSGYRFSFHGVPASAEEIRAKGAVAGSLRAFAYTAAPLQPPDRWAPTGLYGFCSDSQGLFCHTRSGAAPLVAEGRCPPPKKEAWAGDYECESASALGGAAVAPP